MHFNNFCLYKTNWTNSNMTSFETLSMCAWRLGSADTSSCHPTGNLSAPIRYWDTELLSFFLCGGFLLIYNPLAGINSPLASCRRAMSWTLGVSTRGVKLGDVISDCQLTSEHGQFQEHDLAWSCNFKIQEPSQRWSIHGWNFVYM